VEIVKNEIWAIIPARGTSKSIPFKNLTNLGGRPLIDFVIAAAKSSRSINRIICSTENDRIADFCHSRGIEVHKRPPELAQDNTPVIDVLTYTLKDIENREGRVADIIPLLQPTSPFLLPEHIDVCVNKLQENNKADSAQTISTFSHNYHAYNQRIIEGNFVRFRFQEERRICYNKQSKPKHYIFGNLVVTRSSTLLEKGEIFGVKSLYNIIPFYYAADVDGPEELELAEWVLETGKVDLSFLQQNKKDISGGGHERL
jgi:CMP-N-acetylneuraminic acid synthetase